MATTSTNFHQNIKDSLPLGITMASITNGAGRVCDVIDNRVTLAEKYLIYATIKSSSSAPTAGGLYKCYLIRHDGSYYDDGETNTPIGLSDAPVATEPVNAEYLGSIVVSASASTLFRKIFKVIDPGDFFSIVFWNASGQTWHASGHVTRYRALYGSADPVT